jgi:hypothetical protein
VSLYLFVSDLIENGHENDVKIFIEFFIKFLKTLKWQIPKGFRMDSEYQDLVNFQTNVTQAAGEKTAIQKRHDFWNEYFYYYKKEKMIKGDKEYQKNKKKNPESERKNIKL